MKNSIKRAQSQARLSFAERENFRPKVRQLKKTLLTLVALLAVTTGAWATDPKVYDSGEVELFSLQEGDILMPGVTLKNSDQNNIADANILSNRYSIDGVISPYGGNAISSIPFSIGENGLLTAELAGNGPYNCMPITEDGKAGNAWVVTDVFAEPNYKTILIGGTTYPASSGTPVEVAWNKALKTGTFTMPAGNVTVSVEYYDLATLATNGVTAPTTYVWAKTEDPLAVVADGAVTGGTLMFAFGTETTYPDLDGDDWQTAIPTAENLDGAGGTTYVWFYIKGDDEHSDTEPRRLTIHVQPEPEYTVSLAEGTDDAANWKAGKNDATPAALPLEGVKKGDKVTVTYEGLRKVIGMKAEKIVKIKTFGIQGPTGNVSPGQTITFTIINIQPAEATNQTFEWTLESGAPEGTTIESISDDTKTVTVKAGSSMGPITIRATAKDGSGYSNTKQVWLIP